MKIKEILSKIQIKEIAQPLGYMLILCMLYNTAYILCSAYISNLTIYYFVQLILGLASSVGFYWLCLKAWKIEDGFTSQSMIRVLLMEVVFLGLVVGLLATLETYLGSENVVLQVIGALFLFFMIPLELLYFYALSQHLYNFKEAINFIKGVLKIYSRSIFNWFCIALIVVLFIDTITGGMFALGSGIDTCTMASGILLYGNPLMNCMMVTFLASVYGYSFTSILLYFCIYFFVGLWYSVMDMNYIVYIQRKCIGNETKRNRTYKKKNRTSK